jgi:hypothetical protein
VERITNSMEQSPSEATSHPSSNFVTFTFDGELLSLPPNPHLEDHPLSAIRDCLFSIFAAMHDIRIQMFNTHRLPLPITVLCPPPSACDYRTKGIPVMVLCVQAYQTLPGPIAYKLRVSNPKIKSYTSSLLPLRNSNLNYRAA